MRFFYHLLIIFLCHSYASKTFAQWHQYTSTAMTTKLELEFWCEDTKKAKAISTHVFKEFERIDKLMTRYDAASELSNINRLAFKRTLAVSPELFKVLKKSHEISALTNGAFDMTFASLGYLYDYRNKRVPTNAEIDKYKKAIDYQHVVLDEINNTVHFTYLDVKIDLGGIAKGYAVDRGVELLAKAGVKHARLSAGGDMRLLGDKRGKPWLVGIKDPRVTQDRSEHVVALPLSDVSISTSGDYERFFIDDNGERIHHIMSPQTGFSAAGVQSVSVLGSDAMTTDGLSTAIFVLGVEKGLALVNNMKEVDVIVIDAQRMLHFSEGLMPPTLQ